MKINIVNLKDGEHNFEFKEKLENFNYEGITLPSDIEVSAVLYKSAGQITIDAVITGKYILTCDRCVEDYDTDFEIPFYIIYKFENDEELLKNDEDDTIKFISPKTVYISLDEDVKEYIILAVPMKHAPEEIDDVCTRCGRNINELFKREEPEEEEEKENPVWEKLKSLKNK
jgi:uncharacterized metal-binding protein YceD (DUF177 family)